MERILLVTSLICIFGWGALNANAEIALTQPPSKVDPGPAGGNYPTSRFGETPSRPYVAEAMSSSRDPASLTYEDEYAKKPRRDQPLMSLERDNLVPPQLDAPRMASKDLIPDKKGIQEVALIAGEIGFFPKTFFVTRDIPVRLFVTGSARTNLCIIMDNFAVKKQIHAQEIQEITFTPKNSGIYRFYCPINGMEGSMVVREVASTP